jgi:hypothetical protein
MIAIANDWWRDDPLGPGRFSKQISMIVALVLDVS